MLAKKYRLSSRKEIELILRRGHGAKGAYFNLRFLKTAGPEKKVGFIVSGREVKRAVQRNLLKRRAREILRKNIKNLKEGFCLIFLFYKGAAELSYRELETEIVKSLKYAGVAFDNL